MNENKSPQNNLLLRSFFLIAAIIICGVVCILGCGYGISLFTSWRVSEKQRVNQLNDGEIYAIDISKFLGSDWYNEPTSVNLEQEDYTGWHEAIAGAVEWVARSNQNQSGYYKYGIVTYTDEAHASERFDIQQKWIFEQAFGVPRAQQEFPYQSIVLAQPLSVDRYAVGCKNITTMTTLSDKRCSALLLYKNHVVFLDTFLEKDNMKLLSWEQFIELLTTVESKLRS